MVTTASRIRTAERAVYGFLPFGSTHSSVVISSSLTSAASITGNSGVVGGTPTYDSTLGVKVGTGNSVRFEPSAAAYAALQRGGQIRFEIETAGIAQFDSPVSLGENIAANEFAITWAGTNAAGATPFGRMWKNATEDFTASMNSAGASQGLGVSTYAHSDVTTVELTWNGAVYDLYIGGIHHVKRWRYTPFTDMFKFIWIGVDRGDGNEIQNYHIRNFQVSTEPVYLSGVDQYLVSAFGDSLVQLGATAYTNQDLDSTTPRYDGRWTAMLEGRLRERGIDAPVYADGHASHTLSDTGANQLETWRAAFIALNPTYVLIRAGTNDANQVTVPADFETSVKDHITTIMAATSVKGIVIGNVPTLRANSLYDSAPYVANVAAVNAIINGLDDWWDTNNTGDVGRVVVVDLFTAMGGETSNATTDTYFGGTLSGANDDLHPSAAGARIVANTYLAGLSTLMASYPY